MFVGREAQLSELRERLDAALAQRGSLIILAGDSGIGKTYLADRFAREAEDQGFRVHWGRGWQGGGAPAYWPWIQVFRSIMGPDPVERLPSWLDDQTRSYFALILPEIQTDETPDDSEQARFMLFDSVARFLKREAEQQPILIVLDDLHLLDTPSLQMLEFLSRELHTGRVLVVASLREPAPQSDPPGALIGRISREAITMYLTGLDASQARQLIEASGSEAPSNDVVDRLHEVTQGNPLFLSELVRLLTVEGRFDERALKAESVPIPSGIRRAIRQRLSQVDAETANLLRAAAVVGHRFDVHVLARITELSPVRTRGLLEASAAASLVARAGETSDTWTFSHVLVHDVLYEDLPGDARMRLHLLIGEALEKDIRGEPEELVDRLAYHFGEAAPIGGADRALAYSSRAGARSMKVFAYEDAAAHYEQALAILDLEDAPDPRVRPTLLLGLGNARNRAGDIQGSRSAFRSAANAARKLGDARLLADAAFGYGRETFVSGEVDEELIELLEEALQLAGDGDDATRLALLMRLAVELYYTDDIDRRVALADEAVRIARKLGDPTALKRALSAQALAGAGPDNLEVRLRAGTEIIQIAKQLKVHELATDGYLNRIGALLELGEPADADAELARYAKLAERLRQPAHLWFAIVVRAARALMEGRFEAGERLMGEALELGELVRGDEAGQYHAVQRFALLWETRREELGEVEEPLRLLAEGHQALPAFRAMLLAVHLALGRRRLAEAGIAGLREEGLAGLPRNLGWLAALALIAETVSSLDDDLTAVELYDLLLPYEDHNVVYDWSVACFGSAARYLGLLASTLDRPDDAVRHLDSAVATNFRMGARPQAARAQLELAVVLASRDDAGDRDRAKQLLADARDGFRDLGMTTELERTEGLLGRIGEAPISLGEQDAALPSVFRREGEYWSVSFEGDAFRLKDAKGLSYLARLLAEPGREFHALDLFTSSAGGSEPAAQEGLTVSSGESAGPLLDPEAKAAYRRRLEDLDEEIEEAEANNDPERAAKSTEERDFLVRELAAAVGLGGRDRPSDSAAERARVNVTKAIRSAVRRVEEHSKTLGQHLERTLRTGTFCSYRPDPRSPVTWRVQAR